jgi:transcriptional regulator with PAS, ATPase and Fis domain
MDLKQEPWNASNPLILIKDIMNKDYQVLHEGDSIRKAVEIYNEFKLDTIPVVDGEGVLVGVFPHRRLYRALLDGASLDDPCTPYIVESPIYVNSELSYDELSLAVRVNNSPVGNVPVIDKAQKVVGVAGNKEYLRTSISLVSKSYALLESIFHAMQEGIVLVDEKGHILRMNQSAQKMFGIKFSNVKGKHINEVFPEIKFTGRRSLGVRQSIRSVAVITYQYPIIENEQQVGTNLVFLDVSDATEIAKELEIVKDLQTTLSGVLSASSDGVFVTDKYGSIKYANEMAKRLVAGKNDKIQGKSVEELLNTRSLAQVAQTGMPEVDVCRIKGKNCVVSHVPIRLEKETDVLVGVVSTVYVDDNKLTDEITRKWFSLRQQVQYYRNEFEKQGGSKKSSFEHIVSENYEFMQIKEEAQRIAISTSTVLLTGESGVGKDLFARAIHSASPRAGRPFVKVNCVAIPETLFESELFGYAPGSFTGASRKGKTGYFEQADQGTIFLDEIGDMPMSIQVKILQVLQDKQFMRVGGVTTQDVDVRIIAATNRNLRDAIAKGTFREDLYYRLNVIELYLPPLRARAEDILPLAEIFVEKYNDILGTAVSGMSNRAKAALQQ